MTPVPVTLAAPRLEFALPYDRAHSARQSTRSEPSPESRPESQPEPGHSPLPGSRPEEC